MSVQTAGYSGGYSQLKAFVRQVRPMPTPEPVIRFETPAGRQAQVDFARFRFPWGVRYALLVVLGYATPESLEAAKELLRLTGTDPSQIVTKDVLAGHR